MARTSAGWILAAVLAACAVTAQQSKPAFEVASVKPQGSDAITAKAIMAGGGFPHVLPGGRFEADQVTVQVLIWFAYTGLKEHQYVGWPDWTKRDKFAISAKAEGDAPEDQVRLMVQSLLENRFKLVTHMETREMTVQALVMARANRTLGPRLVRMEQECTSEVQRELRRKDVEKYGNASSWMASCSNPGVDRLADSLASSLRVPIVDATGLDGRYYYSLSANFPRPPDPLLGAWLIDPNLPSLSTALEEQLGLKLESRKGPVSVLIIDSVQQPTEN